MIGSFISVGQFINAPACGGLSSSSLRPYRASRPIQEAHAVTQSGRRFGHYDVIPLLDGVFEAPLDVIIHATGDAARRRLIDNWGEKAIRIDVNCFALRGPNGISLIDAGSGNAWGAALGKAREAMREADILPEQIDRVLLTH